MLHCARSLPRAETIALNPIASSTNNEVQTTQISPPQHIADETAPVENENGIENHETETHQSAETPETTNDSVSAHAVNHSVLATSPSLFDRWQLRLNVSQLLLAVLGLVFVVIMIRPQLADHRMSELSLALSRWTAWKDFRDDCRSQSTEPWNISSDCKLALDNPLPRPPAGAEDQVQRSKRNVVHTPLDNTSKLFLHSDLACYAICIFIISLVFYRNFSRGTVSELSNFDCVRNISIGDNFPSLGNTRGQTEATSPPTWVSASLARSPRNLWSAISTGTYAGPDANMNILRRTRAIKKDISRRSLSAKKMQAPAPPYPRASSFLDYASFGIFEISKRLYTLPFKGFEDRQELWHFKRSNIERNENLSIKTISPVQGEKSLGEESNLGEWLPLAKSPTEEKGFVLDGEVPLIETTSPAREEESFGKYSNLNEWLPLAKSMTNRGALSALCESATQSVYIPVLLTLIYTHMRVMKALYGKNPFCIRRLRNDEPRPTTSGCNAGMEFYALHEKPRPSFHSMDTGDSYLMTLEVILGDALAWRKRHDLQASRCVEICSSGGGGTVCRVLAVEMDKGSLGGSWHTWTQPIDAQSQENATSLLLPSLSFVEFSYHPGSFISVGGLSLKAFDDLLAKLGQDYDISKHDGKTQLYESFEVLESGVLDCLRSREVHTVLKKEQVSSRDFQAAVDEACDRWSRKPECDQYIKRIKNSSHLLSQPYKLDMKSHSQGPRPRTAHGVWGSFSFVRTTENVASTDEELPNSWLAEQRAAWLGWPDDASIEPDEFPVRRPDSPVPWLDELDQGP